MKKLVYAVLAVIAFLMCGIYYVTRDESASKTVKIGIVNDGPNNDRSWCQSHNEGAIAAAKGLPVELDIRESVIQDDSCKAVFEDLINKGCGLIIASSYNYGPYLREVSEKHPDVKFVHSGGDTISKNISTCFGRIYQIRYLTGIVAGLQTKTNKIGYVAAFPINEVNRGINAFALGVRKVNPEAKIYVSWCKSWENDEKASNAFKKLDKYDIDVLAVHTNSVAPLKLAEEKGIWTIGYHYNNADMFPKTYLTAAVWDWQRIYRSIFLRYANGRFTSKQFWEGVETGAAKLAPLTDKVAAGTGRVIYREQELMSSNKFDVFYGPIKDNKGNLKVKAGQNITDDKLLHDFGWYVEGVVNVE